MLRFSPIGSNSRGGDSGSDLLIAEEPTQISSESVVTVAPKPIVGVIKGKADSESDLELTIDTGGEDGGVPLGSSTSLPVNSPTVSETMTLPGDSMLSLKWNGFQHHIVESLVTLFRSEELADVTLIADNGEPIKAHKIILALSSPYFRKLFQENPCKHPIIVLQGVRHEEVVQVMNFVYSGQVRVCENEFDDFMEAAESLRIDGINAHPSNISDATDDSPETQSPREHGCGGPSSPRSNDDSQPWHSYGSNQRNFTAIHDDTPTSPVGMLSFRKRSSVSSGISSGTVGSLNEHRGGLSAPSSPPTPTLNAQQQQALVENSIIAGMKPSDGGPSTPPAPPVLIEIDDEEDAKWDFQATRSGHASNMSFRRQQRLFREGGLDRRGQVERRSSLVAEDLSKPNTSRQHSPDFEVTEASSFRTNAGLVVTTPPVFSYKQEKRSTSWPLDSSAKSPTALASTLLSHMTSKSHLLPPVPPRYFPFLSASALPRPIAHHPLAYPSSTMTQTNLPFGFPQQRRLSSPSFGTDSSHESKLKRPRPSSPPRSHHLHSRADLFGGHGSAAHFLAKYGMSAGNSTTALKFTKPKTKAIRSSQVPQSARYTASQVDAMVEKVENFPGPLVPCIVCQKFVKRERLRAHIHECHLLPEEKIECPICKIGLKSKGSFRVHLWRHRRSKVAGDNTKVKDMTSGMTNI